MHAGSSKYVERDICDVHDKCIQQSLSADWNSNVANGAIHWSGCKCGTGSSSLALAIALDRSGSMDGPKMAAARNGALKVVQALEPTMTFLVVTFSDYARVIFGPATGTDEKKNVPLQALANVFASGGTRMSTALNVIVEKFGRDQSRATKVLFLPMAKTKGKPAQHLIPQ